MTTIEIYRGYPIYKRGSQFLAVGRPFFTLNAAKQAIDRVATVSLGDDCYDDFDR